MRLITEKSVIIQALLKMIPDFAKDMTANGADTWKVENA